MWEAGGPLYFSARPRQNWMGEKIVSIYWRIPGSMLIGSTTYTFTASWTTQRSNHWRLIYQSHLRLIGTTKANCLVFPSWSSQIAHCDNPSYSDIWDGGYQECICNDTMWLTEGAACKPHSGMGLRWPATWLWQCPAHHYWLSSQPHVRRVQAWAHQSCLRLHFCMEDNPLRDIQHITGHLNWALNMYPPYLRPGLYVCLKPISSPSMSVQMALM